MAFNLLIVIRHVHENLTRVSLIVKYKGNVEVKALRRVEGNDGIEKDSSKWQSNL